MRLFLFLVLLPLAASAANGEPFFTSPGTYSFRPQVHLLQKKRFEVVYTFSESERSRMDELQKEGYYCASMPQDAFLCSAFQPLNEVHSGLEQRLQSLYAEATVIFGPPRGPAEFFRKSPSVTEWTMPQSVDFQGKHYDTYRFQLTADGVEKITLENLAFTTFITDETGKLGLSYNFAITESRRVYRKYFGLADFAR